MHMADALISPAVGGVMLAATAGLAALSAKRTQKALDESKIPLMGVMGAFVFAAQMINFTIPGTGSSGHLGGGLLLSVLLGPSAGFLTMASVLLIQALFFGDGGLLAYGCNVFNLAFFTCFIAYPLIFRRMTRHGLTSRRIFIGALAASVAGLQLGSLGVVAETLVSGKTELPAAAFLALMQGIHLAIGVVEGLVTAAIVTFVWKARPEIIARAGDGKPLARPGLRPILAGLLAAAVLAGGALSWFASANPDGLEWSLERALAARTTAASNVSATGAGSETGAGSAATSGSESERSAVQPEGIHAALDWLQRQTAILPGYGFRNRTGDGANEPAAVTGDAAEKAGASVSGLVGGVFTLFLAIGIGWLISLSRRRKKKASC